MKKTFITLGLLLFVAVLSAVFTEIKFSNASISAFTQTCYTASATTSPAYQSAGTATSTVTCKLGDGADSAVVTAVVNASSTSSVWNIYVEESMNGQDWFPVAVNQEASTTVPFTVTTRNYTAFTFASSTIGGTINGTNSVGINGTNNRNHYVFNIPVRMRQVRVYSVMPTGSTNGSIWMQIIPKAKI